MTPEQLSLVLGDLVPAAVTALGGRAVEGPVAVTVERPRSGEHGDYATNVALQIGKRVGLVPRELAAELARALGSRPEVARAEVAGPGFVNVWLATAAQGRLARDIVTAGAAYGWAQPLARPERVNLEFVSANPTGPVHIGGVRWAAVGDALGRVLEAAGAQVTREYYFNDTGSQIERFALSLLAAARGEATPPDGYAGGYVDEIAAAVLRRRPGVLDLPPDEALEAFRVAGVDLMFAEIRQSLHDFGVEFDVYFNEKDLHDKGELDAALQRLSARGATYEREGATWLRTTDFGDDKDRVLRKSDGSWTYFAADCAYYLDKRERGFDRAIYMLGADHHGYVGRLRAVAACFGDDPDATVEVLIGQLVNLVKDGEPVRMSKRAGTVVLLADLVEAIGVDAARYALARYSTDSPIDLDVALWARQTDENPVFSVQYAHARTCNVTRNAAQVGLELDAAAFDPTLLDHPREGDLLGVLADYPGVLATAAELREVHRLARYLELLAGTYHRWYDVCRVIPRGDEEVGAINTTRLWLNEATRTVLANGLGLLGVTAPARM